MAAWTAAVCENGPAAELQATTFCPHTPPLLDPEKIECPLVNSPSQTESPDAKRRMGALRCC